MGLVVALECVHLHHHEKTLETEMARPTHLGIGVGTKHLEDSGSTNDLPGNLEIVARWLAPGRNVKWWTVQHRMPRSISSATSEGSGGT